MTAPRPALRGLKHPRAEEPLDLHVVRPLAARLVDWLEPTRVTPNQVTLVSGLTGLACALLIPAGQPWALILAVALLGVTLVLDAADGQLARLRGGGTRLGRMFDGAADGVLDIGLHLALWALLARHAVPLGPWLLPGWAVGVLCIATGVSYSVHAALLDGRRQWFLGRVRPGPGTADEFQAVLAELHAEPRKGRRFVMSVYLLYLRVTEGMAPAPGVARHGLDTPAARQAFEDRVLPLLAATLRFGHTFHRVLAAMSLALACLDLRWAWLYLATVLVPLNAWHLALLWRWKRLDAQLARDDAQ